MTQDTDGFDTKLNILLKEWDYVQNHIGRFDTIIFSIRQWSVTVLAGLLAAAVAAKSPALMLSAVVPTGLFWFIDALHKSFQRRFISRGREIEVYLSSPDFTEALRERTFASFTSPRLSAQFGVGTFRTRLNDVAHSALLRNVVVVHASLMCTCIVLYGFLQFIMR